MKPIPRREILSLAVGFEAGILAVAVLLGWAFQVSPLAQIDGSWWSLLLAVAATVPLLLGAWWSSETRWTPVARLRAEVEHTVVPMFARCSTLDLLVISLLAGVGEEALFRGVIQTGLAEAFHPTVGLLVSGATFGLAHFVTPTYALLAGLIGVYLGLLLLVSQNLLIPIAVHALYDFVALVYLLRERPLATGDEISSR